MILAGGEIYEQTEQERILEGLEEEISVTLSGEGLDRECVIKAADKFGEKIRRGEYDKIIRRAAKAAGERAEEYIAKAGAMMSREALEMRIKSELGNDIEEREIFPPFGVKRARIKLYPLGVLFHIAAGNMEGLPAFSVLEGLLTGNVNILKLPRADGGLTVEIFREMIKIESRLKNYVYIFDTPSTDIMAMEKMAAAANGIAVWGGDEAVRAVRRLAKPGVRLIEWGHKLGFAYISGYEDKERELAALAEHIISTRQLLCSSCQVIFIDTEDMGEVQKFSEEFLPYLERAGAKYPMNDIGAAAEISLKMYTDELETAIGAGDSRNICCKKIYRGKNCSVNACGGGLELSYMHGNCLVKPLRERDIVKVLRGSKEYLQTAGLICEKDRRERLETLLIKAGVCRVMGAGNMSEEIIGGSHDGEFGLRRYMRAIVTEARD
ncbi:MAG: acyl-CoA reductase [Oscillospiraceae bacterium]|nr:acyl-CoA reductase [Oscillospiraceae bacterium]